MRLQGDADPAVVEQARAGDREALERLVSVYLPLVYNVVGRAMDGHRDVDDVVQETMLRAVHNLPALREPERFRPWLIAIAVRQVRTWWRSDRARPRPGIPEETAREADPQADFADLAVLRLELSGQRREAVEATRWLEDNDRELLSLWWMEAAGRLTRPELVEACGLTPHHTTVRVQRVKDRLHAARSILRAMAASPRCPGLTELMFSWDGRPGPLWRKRLHRHVRECLRCRSAASALVPAEGLLGGLALVPLPVALAGRILPLLGTGSGASAGTGAASSGNEVRGPHDAVRAPGSRGTVRRTLRTLSRGPITAAVSVAVVVAAGVGWYAAGGPVSPRSVGAASPAVSSPAPSPASATRSPSVSRAPTPSPEASTSRAATPTPSTSVAAGGSEESASSAGCGGTSSRTWANWPMPDASTDGSAPSAAYTDLGDGTVRDDVTCLVWQRDAAPATYTYTDAKAYCADLGLAGGSWHLPTRIELMSLVDTTRAAPAIDTAAFPGAPPEFFWTSSAWAVTKAPLRAWIVNFYEGLSSNGAYQSGTFHVRCVRSPDGTGGPAYRTTADEVTDTATGLTWQRGASPATLSAAEAAAYCRDLDLGGHTWRLPGVKELATTVDESRVAPAVDANAFPGTPTDAWYWTASTAAPEPSARWALNYEDGYTDYRDVTVGHARCVR